MGDFDDEFGIELGSEYFEFEDDEDEDVVLEKVGI